MSGLELRYNGPACAGWSAILWPDDPQEMRVEVTLSRRLMESHAPVWPWRPGDVAVCIDDRPWMTVARARELAQALLAACDLAEQVVVEEARQ